MRLNKLEDMQEVLSQATTLEGLQSFVEDLRNVYDIEHLVYHSVNSTGGQYAALTYDPDWVDRYLEQDYARIDPVVQGAYRRFHPVDWKQRKGNHKFFLKAKFPIVPGYDISGRIVKCGINVRDFQTGDEVICRLTRRFGGAFAEYASARQSTLSKKPVNIDHVHAAALPCTKPRNAA